VAASSQAVSPVSMCAAACVAERVTVVSNEVGARQRVTGVRFRMCTGVFPRGFIA